MTLAGPTEVELQIEAQLVQHLGRCRKLARAAALDGPGRWRGVWRDWREHYPDRSLLPGMATRCWAWAQALAVDLAQRYTQGDAAGGPTRTEVLITTSLKTTDRYLAGSADQVLHRTWRCAVVFARAASTASAATHAGQELARDRANARGRPATP